MFTKVGQPSYHRERPNQTVRNEPKGIDMLNKKSIIAAIRRGFECSGANALASAGYSESVVEAYEKITDNR